MGSVDWLWRVSLETEEGGARMPDQGFEVTGDLYNRIFAVQTSSGILVDYAVWNAIFAGLPKGYLLPDTEIYHYLPQK